MADGSLFGRVRGPRVVDLFAGAGGASEGVRRALGVSPIVAVNHCAHAIAMHQRNHPETEHYLESVFDVAPLAAARGRAIDLLWASPDCTHFSRAKGGKPRDKGIRSLAWVIVDWAREVRPRVICMENVAEFQTWGPLDDEGQPLRERAGETFREFVATLRGLGYAVDWRVLNAADYGAPTSRKRLFLVARCDGEAPQFPAPTHGPGRAHAWRTAAECIDWSLPIPSIFERARPLAEPTQRRIAEGIRRYVLENPRPFLLCLTHGGRLEPITEPLRTTTTANRGERALVAPLVAPVKSWGGGGNEAAPADRPLRTVTGSKRGEFALVAPSLIRTDMQSDGRLRGVADVEEPLRTVTTGGGHGLVSASLVHVGNGEREGQTPRTYDVERPLGTVVAGGNKHALVAAFLAKHNGGENGHQAVGQDLAGPMHTIAGNVNKAVVGVHLTKFQENSRGQAVDAPLHTVMAGAQRFGLVAAFMAKYYGSGGQWAGLDEPVHTLTGKARMGLVTVTIAGDEYVLADIGMRMLQPHELAAANGWRDMVLFGTKSDQIARIGNMVVPDVAEALVRVNLPEYSAGRAAA